MIGNNFYGYHDALKIYGAPKLCTETILSNPPVVQPKSSCDIHLLRSPWIDQPGSINFGKNTSSEEN